MLLAVYGGSFFFTILHPAIIFAVVVSSWFAAVGSARTADIDCASIRTHANLRVLPYSHQTTRKDGRMTRKGITYAALGGHFFLVVVLLRSVVGYQRILDLD